MRRSLCLATPRPVGLILKQPQQQQFGSRPLMSGPPNGIHNPNPYPWSQRQLKLPATGPPPFPRYGAAVNSTASKEGDIYVMGGLVGGSTVKGDLWMVEAGSGKLACYNVRTEAEGPGPRVGHASLLVGNAFIVFGGDTKQDENDVLDDTLYLLNTCTCDHQASKSTSANRNSHEAMVESSPSWLSSSRPIRPHS